MSKRTILFISHSAARTGAPTVLLHLQREIARRGVAKIVTALMEEGPLSADFRRLGDTVVLPQILPKLIRRLGWGERFIPMLYRLSLRVRLLGRRIDLVYANTITTGEVVEATQWLECPLVTHVHELRYWVDRCGPRNLEIIDRRSTKLLAASRAVRNVLVEDYGLEPTKVVVAHEFVPTAAAERAPDRMSARRALGIDPDAFVVIGSGYGSWIKGKDLFVQIASLCIRRAPHLAPVFLWVGGWQSADHERSILHDVRTLGLDDRVRFVGEVENPLEVFAAGDVFALTSREDPFPLVCLESASLGLPIICFDSAGGMPELVENDAGEVVPCLDLDAFASAIIRMADDSEWRASAGRCARQKVRERHDVATGASRIIAMLDDILKD